VEPDGTFFLLLPQGGHRLAVRYIPWGYAVRSFTSGAVDLQMALLEVSANTTPGPIRATLAAAPTTGVQVKGRLTGLPPGVTQNAQVTLIQIGSSNQKALTSPGADGGFVFSSVPPGFYHVFLTPPAVGGGQSAILYPRLWTIHTGDQGIANIVSRGMIISGFADGGLGLANTTPPNIRGQVIVRDEAGATPSLPSGLAVRSSGNSHIAGVAADGSFTLPVANGSHYPVLENVPPGYAITSMTLGSTDVLSTPFSVVVSALPTDELRIVLSFDRRAAEEGRNRIQLGSIAGRLLNSDGTPAVDVEVHAAPISFSPAASSTRTDMTGAYRLMDLPPGDYSLIVGPIEAMPSTARGRVVAAAGNTDLRTSLQYGKQIEIGTAVGFTQLISGARGTTVWYRLQN
jgi:hypothetical protein